MLLQIMLLQVEAEADIPEDPEEDEIDLFIHEDDRLEMTFDGPGQTDHIRCGRSLAKALLLNQGGLSPPYFFLEQRTQASTQQTSNKCFQ